MSEYYAINITSKQCDTYIYAIFPLSNHGISQVIVGNRNVYKRYLVVYDNGIPIADGYVSVKNKFMEKRISARAIPDDEVAQFSSDMIMAQCCGEIVPTVSRHHVQLAIECGHNTDVIPLNISEAVKININNYPASQLYTLLHEIAGQDDLLEFYAGYGVHFEQSISY